MALAVGLDIGTHHVRAVALNGTRMTAHASAARFAEDGGERPLATVVAELAESMPLKQLGAVASSELDVLARFLHVAPLPQARLDRILRLELSPEEGPAPCIDAVRLAAGGDDVCYLGLVAETGAVRLLQAELARASVRPRAITWGPLALAAAATRLTFTGDELVLIIDIGASGTDVALVGEGRLLACRRLAIGGDHFSEALIKTGMTPAEAEHAKRAAQPLLPTQPQLAVQPEPPAAPRPIAEEFASDPPDHDDFVVVVDDHRTPLPSIDEGEARTEKPAPPSTTVSSSDLRLDDEADPLRSPGVTTVAMASISLGPQLTRAAEGFYGQVATTLAFFKAQLKRSELAPAKVLLCGGGASLVALEPYLARRFQLPVERFDPCAGLEGAPDREPWLWARAVGLAIASSSAEVPRADLRPESDLRREAWRRQLVWPWVAAACLLAAGAVASLALSERVERDRTEAELLERAVDEHKRLSSELATLEGERDAAYEDLRAIAGRIHAARDLLFTVRALKEQTVTAKELWVTSLRTVGIGRDENGDDIAPPSSSGGSRLGGAGRGGSARKDSLIDRGAIMLSGRVRFDVQKNDNEMVAFRNAYQQALSDWTTPDGSKLFRDVRLTNTNLVRNSKKQPVTTAAPLEAGEFPFTFRCEFPLTSLSEPASAQPEKGR